MHVTVVKFNLCVLSSKKNKNVNKNKNKNKNDQEQLRLQRLRLDRLTINEMRILVTSWSNTF